MGTLIGHVVPGLGLFMIGLWHMYNHLRLLARNGPSSYRSYAWFPSGRLTRCLELYLIIAGTTLGVAMELFIIGPPLDTDGTIPSKHLHNFEHWSMSLTLLVYALFALALDKWAALKPIPAQHDVLQLVQAVAFAQELLVFHLHSADHMGVEGQYHWLLQLLFFVSLTTTLLGVGRGRTNFVLAYARSISIMFQGVWFIVIGFALWTPSLIAKGCFMQLEEDSRLTVVKCDGEDSLHRAKALVNIQFSWLLILVSIFTASFYVFMMLLHGKSSVEYNLIMPSTVAIEEEEEDVEAQRIIEKKLTEIN